ncbi:hypothetical protein EV401DRAFT_1888338 [Pisolithus croceorrhizus]|nr:hypothetical protein EV401DRAFT_1888338 [Pisolithus croceorrhizus]
MFVHGSGNAGSRERVTDIAVQSQRVGQRLPASTSSEILMKFYSPWYFEFWDYLHIPFTSKQEATSSHRKQEINSRVIMLVFSALSMVYLGQRVRWRGGAVNMMVRGTCNVRGRETWRGGWRDATHVHLDDEPVFFQDGLATVRFKKSSELFIDSLLHKWNTPGPGSALLHLSLAFFSLHVVSNSWPFCFKTRRWSATQLCTRQLSTGSPPYSMPFFRKCLYSLIHHDEGHAYGYQVHTGGTANDDIHTVECIMVTLAFLALLAISFFPSSGTQESPNGDLGVGVLVSTLFMFRISIVGWLYRGCKSIEGEETGKNMVKGRGIGWQEQAHPTVQLQSLH